MSARMDVPWPTLRLSVELALFTVRSGRLGVLATRRAEEPEIGLWSLPSVAVGAAEDPDLAAERLLRDSVGQSEARPGVFDAMFLEQLRTYGDPMRTGVHRTVAVGYVALVADLVPAEQFRVESTRVFDVDDLVGAGFLAFDHDEILADAIERVRAKFEYTTIATSLVVEPFTIPELRRVYESVWGVSLHPANFRRKVLATPGFVVPSGLGEAGAAEPGPSPDAAAVAPAKRGPDLYRRGTAALLHPAMLRPAGGEALG